MKTFGLKNLIGVKKRSVLIAVILSASLQISHSIEVEKELTISSKEKQALDEFKSRIQNANVSHQSMKSDLALIRWLRNSKLNINAAEEAFNANIKWRNENSIDTILDEDWSDFKEEFYFDDTGTDFSGRPVIAADISEWNVRDAVVSGKRDKLLRYMLRGVESASTRIRKLQEQGQNVTQWQVLLNMDNFNLVQHGCLNCLPIYLQFIMAHNTYYPYGADKIVIINTPTAFEVVLNLVRPVMSADMRDSLIVLGTNRNQWRKVLLSIADVSQLAPHFGGIKPTNY